MNEKKQSSLSRLLGYAGGHKKLTILGCTLSGVSAALSLMPYVLSLIHIYCLAPPVSNC